MITSDHVNEPHAELSGDRYITDCGPECQECHATAPGCGMYLYLVATPSFVLDHDPHLGIVTVYAQCAVCHYARMFRMEWTGRLHAQDIRKAHESVPVASSSGPQAGPIPYARNGGGQ